MDLLISGDFYISESVPVNNLFSSDLEKLFQSSDFNIVNLESPITKKKPHLQIIKSGPHLNGNDQTFNLLKQINTNLVTLANNHIMDYGRPGLEDTLAKCKANSISHIGAGISIKEAKHPYIISEKHIKIAILNFAENEFASAEIDKAGANPLDIIDNIKQIQNIRAKVDFIIAIIHGGHEHYHLPSPRMVKQYRYYAEIGVDAIIGHHPHCISGFEIYKGVPIFYSLGNMIFTKRPQPDFWYTGLSLKLSLNKGKPIEYKLFPTRVSRNTYQLDLLSGEEKRNVLEEVNRYSEIISDDKKLLENWESFVKSWMNHTLQIFSPIRSFPGKYFRAILRRLGANRIMLKNKYLVPIYNNIHCEALYDLSKEVIKTKIWHK